MMVESSPPSPFVVVQSQLILELLKVALDAPADLCQADQVLERNILGHR
jgi:hypothetical protein